MPVVTLLPYLDIKAKSDTAVLYHGYDTYILVLDVDQVWKTDGQRLRVTMPDVVEFFERFLGLPADYRPSAGFPIYVIWSCLHSLCGKDVVGFDDNLTIWKQVVLTWRWIRKISTLTKPEQRKGTRFKTMMDWYHDLKPWERVNLPSR